ncbi:MAG TPA: translation factor GTPase family protein, partial [Gemmatimonadales bacterium]|nr:translation factor GTPase family protein [Gemmatimonadales bacterium]
MRTLNLGILAHVDAGKTTLTERLLHAAGVIDEIGNVDDGNTQTDTLALERERGITIKSAVVSFVVDDLTINLIDTPGHPDFIAEVERVLNVLEGVVLVLSAVEGVQPQTRVLMRTLQRLRIPTLLFVNKIDRSGANPEQVLQAIAEKLSQATISMGSVRDAGSRSASFLPVAEGDEAFSSVLVELLAQHDDALMAAYLDGGVPPPADLVHALAAQTGKAVVHPVFFGSALTGAGVEALICGITRLLPAGVPNAEAPLSGSVFKVERGPAGEKMAYVRLFSGSIPLRGQVRFGEEHQGKVTGVAVFERGRLVRTTSLAAGQIGTLRGLEEVQVGHAVGAPQAASPDRHFAPPTLEAVVVPLQASERVALHAALTQLAEQDPLINLRQDGTKQDLFVSLYGEVQKEVIQATLARDFGLDVEFHETTTICVERPVGVGTAAELLKQEGNPFLAAVGLRVETAAVDTGVQFRLSTEVLGTMPLAFFRAVEESVHETLRQGLYGWQVTDCLVTMTHSGYFPRQSHAHQGFSKSMSSTGADFRGLTPLVVMSALKEAGTAVCEPIHRFRLEFPSDAFGAMAPLLARSLAVPRKQELRASAYVLEGEIPAARVHDLQQQLP